MLQEIIEKKLHDTFFPKHLKVVNESYMHNVPPGSESHFKVIVVSNVFNDMRLIARHRKVNQALSQELQNGLHALSIHTYTETEWLRESELVPKSPDCLGGNKIK